MRIFLTGSRGLIGGIALGAFVGHEVVEFDKRRRESMDMRDPDAVLNHMVGCDTVVHLAAVPHPFHPVDYDAINRVGGENVFRAAHVLGIDRVVHMSSSDVYGICGGPTQAEPLVGAPWAENWTNLEHAATCPYAKSKVDLEHWLARSEFKNVVVLRLEAPSPPTDPKATRLGLKAPHALIERALQAALRYDGRLTANLVLDPREKWFKMDNLRRLLAT